MNATDLTNTKPPNRTAAGFTLVELLAVLAVLALLAALLSPALARTKPDASALGCRNSLAQLTRAWNMYAEDNSGSLVYNRDGFKAGKTAGVPDWVAGWLDFTSSNSDNTNINLLLLHDSNTNGTYAWGGFLGPYLKSPAPFKCPADRSTVNIGGQMLPRVRSYSMNNLTGTGARTWTTPSKYSVFSKSQDILSPANLFVFLDEHEGSINDGVFFSDPDTLYQVIDVPASRHGWAAGLCFADGHSETHRWRDSRTVPQAPPGTLLQQVYNLPGDADIVWLSNHAVGQP
jgi:prepilin-type N-terminal cleavage/methylation domain-containing protein